MIDYKKERETRIRLKNDFPFFAHNCLKIRPKDGDLVDFRLNKAQRYIHDILERQLLEKNYVKAIILKGRQQGCSTYIGGRDFWKVIHNKGLKAFILTHRSDATDNLFKMTLRYYKYLPDTLKPYVDRNNAKELSFTILDSGYKVGTAGSGSVGRSDTIQLFHGSEVAFWDNASDIVSGVMQAIPKQSEIILESTANGMGNYFHEQWMFAEKGETDFIPIFIPWYWQDEYREDVKEGFSLDEEETEIRDLYGLENSQMAFRRKKIKEMGQALFKQEYPLNPIEAFQASVVQGLIKNELVVKARKEKTVKPYGPLIIGVDPSRNQGDGDRTSIICRQGRVAFDLQSFRTDDLMEVVGVIVNYINKYNPYMICIDVIGIGAGIVDRLRELGYRNIVKPINCGETAYNKAKYKNKKAEMWGETAEWLADTPCSIPDVDSIQTDLCCVTYKYNSNTQIVLEDKDSLRKRGFKSPDEAEALVLTFAFPVNETVKSSVKSYSTIERIW